MPEEAGFLNPNFSSGADRYRRHPFYAYYTTQRRIRQIPLRRSPAHARFSLHLRRLSAEHRRGLHAYHSSSRQFSWLGSSLGCAFPGQCPSDILAASLPSQWRDRPDVCYNIDGAAATVAVDSWPSKGGVAYDPVRFFIVGVSRYDLHRSVKSVRIPACSDKS